MVLTLPLLFISFFVPSLYVRPPSSGYIVSTFSKFRCTGFLDLYKYETLEAVWRMDLGVQLFALFVVDFTGDGQQEIVTASWDGQVCPTNILKSFAP